MVIGLAMGNDNSKDNTTKKNVYKSVQELAAKFKDCLLYTSLSAVISAI